MQINRSNYEIWFIDWLDGNLDDIQLEKLMHFLQENPDLKEEFDEMNSVKLRSSKITYPHKNHLKKSTTDITESQFEYLCIAYAENDLSAEQSTELKEIVYRDSEKRRIFELFQKTKLTPEPVKYKSKKLLIKRTIGQDVMRFAIVGLSAAAVIIFGIISFHSKQNLLPHKLKTTAQNIQSSVVNGRDRSLHLDVSKKIIADASARITGKRLNSLAQYNKMTNPAERNLSVQQDSLSTHPVRSSITIEKVIVSSEVTLDGGEISRSIVAFNPDVVIASDYDDGQSRFSKFIAKAIRGKLLREKTPKDSPLKAYEIAEAGITGLNKLLGWEMALDERKDENGKLKSVYFSSKLLKFNAPVNKVETVK
jgi:hypothetical protein